MNAEKRRRFITIVYDPGLRTLLQDFFEGDQYEVESPSNGLDAFHQLAKKYFDLIITDCQMPGLGGVDLLPRLKRIHPWARVIVLPAKRMNRHERKTVESAADVYLAKPFQLNDLKMIIQRLFHTSDDKALPTEEGWKSGRLSMEVG